MEEAQELTQLTFEQLRDDREMIENRSNWAGNYTYTAPRLHYPQTIEQVQELVSRSSKLKVLGSRHSFNHIADTPGDLISLERLERVLVFDRERHTVTVDGGVRYGQICRQIYQAGYALHNMASLPHISVAGACATATHGSGDRNGNLATAVSALELVTADGAVTTLSRKSDPMDGQAGGQANEQFQGMVVGLGGLGVVTKLTLDLVPALDMRQNVYENLPLAHMEEHFDDIVSSADSVSLLTDWQDERINYVWLKRRAVRSVVPGEVPGQGVADQAVFQPESFGATAAATHRHPIPGFSAESCTEQMGIVGPWYDRLPHFRMDFTPSSGEELQSEYLVPREHALAALRAIANLRGRIAPLLQISEVRTIAADELWMSPCYRQACIGIHFTWKKDWHAVRQLLPVIEEDLAVFNARPHWGKLFTMPPTRVQSLYPRLSDFRELLRRYDPSGKFRNAFLDTYVL